MALIRTPSRTQAQAPAQTRAAPAAVRPPRPGWRGGLAALAGVAMPCAMAGALLYAPTERVQGDVQRIVYVHVSLAWVAYLAFFVVFLGSIAYLFTRAVRWDILARASAEIGLLFTTLVLLTGALWARPIWGTWWSWDARLTTTLVLWLLYVGYATLRAQAGDDARAARYAAVLGIIGFLDVPIVHQSVVWWRTIHPGPTVFQPGGGIGMPPAMFQVLLLSILAFTLLYAYLLAEKVSIEWSRERLARWRAQHEAQ